MKLAAIAVVASLGLGGAAYADRAGDHDAPAATAPAEVAPRGPTPRPRGEVREVLLERFDRNHDGVLQPAERRRAIHALRRLARRMAMEERRRQVRDARARDRISRAEAEPGPDNLPPHLARTLRRLDTNHDGRIGPDEMPPGLARRLRRFDRNGDGVLSPDELPPEVSRPRPPAERAGGSDVGDGANL